MKNFNKTSLFLMLTFGICYTMVGVFWLLGGHLKSTPGFILAICYMFVPLLSVLVVEKLVHKQQIRQKLAISFKINKWFFVGWLVMPVVGFAAFGISLLFKGVSYSPDLTGIMERYATLMTPEQLAQMKEGIAKLPVNFIFVTLVQGMFAGITVNAIAGFGEELGWRGFLLYQFSKMSFLKASLLIGFIWGIWHAPLILMGHNYPQHPQIGVLMMIIWCILLTPIFIYITLKANSVIAASIVHGTLNGTAGIAIILIKGGSDLTIGITGLAGFIALLVANVVLFAYDRWIAKENIISKVIGDIRHEI